VGEPIWTPSPARIIATNLTRFAAFARERHPQRVLVAAGSAPRRKNVDHRHLTLEVCGGQAERAPLDRREPKIGYRLTDQW